MNTLSGRSQPLAGPWKGLAMLGGAVASLAAGAGAAVLAVVFTAALAVLAVMGMALVGLTAAALRNRGAARAHPSDVIEAHHVGGRSWVAYGWDQDGRKV